jgi:uroporphyrinogen decarboxylase
MKDKWNIIFILLLVYIFNKCYIVLSDFKGMTERREHMGTSKYKDQMTPKERIIALKKNQPFDRIPCGLCPGDYLYKLVGGSISDLYVSAEQMVKSQIQARKLYEIQSAGVGPVVNGIAEAIGCKLTYPQNDSPYIIESIIKDYDDIKKLDIPNPKKSGRLPIILDALEQLQECLGNEVPIISEIPGPFTTASNIRGIENIMFDLYGNPKFVKELIDFSLRSTMAYVNEASKLGVSFSISDPVASLIGDTLFHEFEFPYLKNLALSIINMTGEAPLLHICGYTANLWTDMADTGAATLSLDQEIDLEAAKQEVGHKVVLYGNIDPIKSMLHGSPADVEEAAKRCILKAYDNAKGFILGLGCGMPINTPEENIHAFLESARKFGQYPVNPQNLERNELIQNLNMI